MSKKIARETKLQIVDYYKSNPVSLEEVSEKFDLCIPVISKILKQYNVPLWKKNKLYSPELKEDYFSEIDSHEKAYFLGLITTDGCVFWKNAKCAFLTIELNASDKYILEMFMAAVKCNRKLVYSKRSNTYTATITSTKMVKDLEKYNIRSRSSLTQQFCNTIPKQYYSDYIRGIIDGDGSIGFYSRLNRKVHAKSIRICSENRDFLVSLTQMMTDLLDVNKVNIAESKSDHSYNIEYKRNHDLETIIEFLYSSEGPYLERKKIIADKILSEIREYRDNYSNRIAS